MYAYAITDAATIGARPAIEWQIRGHSNSGVEVFPIIQTTWRTGLVEKISRYRLLPHNWNSYGSPPPSLATIQKAIWFVSSLLDEKQPRPRVNPVSGGGIQFEWSFDEREVEIEFMPDGAVQYLKADNRQSEECEGPLVNPTSSDISRLLRWLIDA